MEKKLEATKFRNDYFGDISMEYADTQNPYNDLAKKLAVDLNEKYLVGVTFNKNDNVQTIVFTTTNIGTTYSEVEEYLKSHDTLPCEEIQEDIDINEFFKYTKRLSFMFTKNKNPTP